MHAPKAVFERHECKLSLDAAQVDLDYIHVSWIKYEENLQEGIRMKILCKRLINKVIISPK